MNGNQRQGNWKQESSGENVKVKFVKLADVKMTHRKSIHQVVTAESHEKSIEDSQGPSDCYEITNIQTIFKQTK